MTNYTVNAISVYGFCIFYFVFQTLYNSMGTVLSYEGDDMESVFLQTFRVCSTDVFGTLVHHDLKSNGDSIFVDQHNKKVRHCFKLGISVNRITSFSLIFS